MESIPNCDLYVQLCLHLCQVQKIKYDTVQSLFFFLTASKLNFLKLYMMTNMRYGYLVSFTYSKFFEIHPCCSLSHQLFAAVKCFT